MGGGGLDGKRVYADERDATTLYVAGPDGLARVRVAGDRIGRVALPLCDPVRDVAGRGGRVLVATDGVLVGAAEGFEPTGFGPARAVGLDGDRPLAAREGRVATLGGDGWVRVGGVEGPRAFDGPLLAAADGVYRARDGVERVDRPGARDVAVAESCAYAARGDGLYAVGGERLRDGPHGAVAAGEAGVYAVADGRLVERSGERWAPVTLPVEGSVADVAVRGSAVYAVTDRGTALVRVPADRSADGQGGWRDRALGVRARRLAAP